MNKDFYLLKIYSMIIQDNKIGYFLSWDSELLSIHN